MKSIVCYAATVLAVTLGPGILDASGPIAVYALVDKVAFEPSAEKPARIRISGVFITYQGTLGPGGGYAPQYSAPQRGYLYFTLPARNEELALKEWADMKSVAGARQVIGFGSSFADNWRVWKPDEEAKAPDEYPVAIGLIKINADQPRAKALLDYKER